MFRWLFLVGLAACGTSSQAEPPPTGAPASVSPAAALVGKPAPDFTLKDLNGADVSLASLRGKTVVLEWFNPDCPFVVASHTKGSLVDTAARHAPEGVAWLAINSGAPGKQGNAVERNVERATAWDLRHPILRDESGAVGKTYGATNTPQMFVIDPQGLVRYAGAIDNSPDGERGAPQGGPLVNYIDAALSDLAAGKPVTHPVSKPYGCGVKYSS